RALAGGSRRARRVAHGRADRPLSAVHHEVAPAPVATARSRLPGLQARVAPARQANPVRGRQIAGHPASPRNPAPALGCPATSRGGSLFRGVQSRLAFGRPQPIHRSVAARVTRETINTYG